MSVEPIVRSVQPINRGALLAAVVLLVGLAASPSSQASGSYTTEGKIVVAVSVDRGDGIFDSDLFVMRPDGSGVRNLTDQAWGQGEPDSSPDGRKIAYSSESGLYVMRSDGSGAKMLRPYEGGGRHHRSPRWPSWSPDGTRMLYAENLWDPETDTYGPSNLVVVSAQGQDRQKLATYENEILSPSWSPDGKNVVFWSCDDTKLVITYDSQCSIHLIGADGKRDAMLSPDVRPSDRWPVWTPGGDILFVGERPCSGAALPGCTGIYRMDRDGSNVRLIAAPEDWTGDGRVDEYYRVVSSPDSARRLLVVIDAGGQAYDPELWLWDTTSGRRTKIFRDRMTLRLDWQARCNVRGTQGDDVLTGTNGRDLICGSGGDDVIRGLGGDDVIFGHGGNDRVSGGSGRDIVVGNAGRDRCGRDERDYSLVC